MKKGELTTKKLNKVFEKLVEYEKEHPTKWYWRITRKFPFIEKYTIISIRRKTESV